MIPGLDINSLMLLFLGKDNAWIPFILLMGLVIQKWDHIMAAYDTLIVFGKTRYDISGTIYTNVDENNIYGQFGTSMWALIRHINDIVKADKNLLSTATSIKFPVFNDVFDKNDIVVIPSSKSTFEIAPDIAARVTIARDTRQSNNSERSAPIDMLTITITLITTKKFNTIVTFMNKIIEDHNKKIEEKNKCNQYIIKPQFGKKKDDPSSTEMEWAQYSKFKTSKTFDTLFFDGKNELLHRLDTFINRDKYKVLGLPETLGLLFYGEPGTGKTSCIKAVAKYLDMSLVIVPMSHIKTKKRLEELFFSERLMVPQEKRIYVFEEIDCNGWEDIVRDRRLLAAEAASGGGNKKSSSVEPLLLEKLAETLVGEGDGGGGDKSFKKENEDKLTLGGILEIIDGLVECPGRVIIMTTNHKEHVDSALLRPGRIDMEIEFKKLRGEHIAHIYQKWYGEGLEDHCVEDIPDYKYSQAEISQLLFKYEKDKGGFIKAISCS
jgi:hypothetical protein